MKTILILLFVIAVTPGGALAQAEKGVVTGEIRSEDGTPAVGLRVAAVVAEAEQRGPGIAVYISIAQTDSAGRYRLEDIPPGRYAIMAGPIDFPTYHPGVRAMADATIVPVTAGLTAGGFDFTLKLRPTAPRRVSGRVVGLPESNALPSGLSVSLLGGGSIAQFLPDQGIRQFQVPVRIDGSFEFPAVPPGTYAARVIPGTLSAWLKEIVVDDRELTGIELVAPPIIRGRIVLDGGGRLPIPGSVAAAEAPRQPQIDIRILATRTVANTPLATGALEMSMNPDGAFALELIEGEYRVSVTGLPFGYYLKSITYRSTDLLHEPLKIDKPDSAEIQVTLTATAPESAQAGVRVSGRVTGVPAGGAIPVWVYLYGSTALEGVRGGAVRLQSDGTFEFSKVPRGAYIARAIFPGLIDDPFASARIAVAEQDLKVELAVSLRAQVVGQIVVVDRNGLNLPLPTDLALAFRHLNGTAKPLLLADGSFWTTLLLGEHSVGFAVLPAGYSIKSISSGPVDLLQAPLKLDGITPPAELQIRLEYTP